MQFIAAQRVPENSQKVISFYEIDTPSLFPNGMLY